MAQAIVFLKLSGQVTQGLIFRMKKVMRSYGYASAGDCPIFADMDVGVRATQEQLAEFARFPLSFVLLMQYTG